MYLNTVFLTVALVAGGPLSEKAAVDEELNVDLFDMFKRQYGKTSGKRVRERYTPSTPLAYSKTGVYRGIPIVLFLTRSIIYGNPLKPPN